MPHSALLTLVVTTELEPVQDVHSIQLVNMLSLDSLNQSPLNIQKHSQELE